MELPTFLDANVFMYAARKPHPFKNSCIHILKNVETQTLSAVIDTEILQELLYRYSYIGLADKGIKLCHEILKYPLKMLSITEADIRLIIDLFDQYRNKGVKVRDAIHAATMQNNGIIQLISADKDFDHFDFLTRIDPKDSA